MTNPVNIHALAQTAHPLVQIHDGQAITLSTEVARVFDKEHRHVLRDIENLCANLPTEHQPNFGRMSIPVDIGNGATRQSPAYHLTRDGFTLLAMGFTGKKAMAFKLAYIDAFNRMEETLAAQAQQPAQNYHNVVTEQAYALANQTAVLVADKMYRAVLTGQVTGNPERWTFLVSNHDSKVKLVDPRSFVLTPAEIAEGVRSGEILADFSDGDLAQLAQAALDRLKRRLDKPAQVKALTAITG